MNLRSVTGTRLIGIAAIAVVALASWLLLISPVLDKTSAAKDATSMAEDRNRLMTTQVAALKRQREDLPVYERTAAGLARLFPPTADQPGFFAAVVAAAGRAGIASDNVTTLSPSAPQLLGPDGQPLSADALAAQGDDAPRTDVAQQSVAVSAEGSYDQIQRLLAALDQMDRAFVVSSLSVERGGDGEGDTPATLTVSITGSTYVAAPLEKAALEDESSTSAAG